MSNTLIIGQGDVSLVRIGDARRTKKKDVKAVTLAIGEESGHSHVLKAGVLTIEKSTGKKYLDVPQETQVVVEGMPWRHTALTVPAGRYELLDGQIEYTPKAIVRSAD